MLADRARVLAAAEKLGSPRYEPPEMFINRQRAEIAGFIDVLRGLVVVAETEGARAAAHERLSIEQLKGLKFAQTALDHDLSDFTKSLGQLVQLWMGPFVEHVVKAFNIDRNDPRVMECLELAALQTPVPEWARPST